MWLLHHSGKAGHEASKAALADAQENLVRVNMRTPEVQRVALALRTMRERNHFAEKLSFITWKGDC